METVLKCEPGVPEQTLKIRAHISIDVIFHLFGNGIMRHLKSKQIIIGQILIDGLQTSDDNRFSHWMVELRQWESLSFGDILHVEGIF